MRSIALRNATTSLVLGSALVVGLLVACSDDDEGKVSTPKTTPEAGTDAPALNRCVDAGAAPTGDCTNTKCSATLGEPAICRNNACVKLKSEHCPIVIGKVDDDRTIIIGSIAPINGASANEGVSVRNSIDLALREINTRGIPTDDVCEAPRPMALVGCDENEEVDIKGGANHLVNELGVQAIIGANFSGDTIHATTVTLPGKVLLISPSATAARITTLEGATQEGTRLMWRTSPSDVIQSEAMRSVYVELEAAVKAAPGGPTNAKVAIISKSDAYGLGIDQALRNGLSVNGKPHGDASNNGLVEFRCYNPPATAATGTAECPVANTMASAVTALQTLKPESIILTGTAEAVLDILIPYEASNPTPKPRWLLPDGIRTAELTNYAKDKPDFIARVRGTVPGVVTPLAQAFFNIRYTAAFPENPTLVFGMAGAYDATYMIAYGIAANGSKPITGIEIAKNLAKLAGGTEKIDVGPARLSAGFAALTSGGAVDLNGTSGPLDFDPATGEARSDIAVWCLRVDPNTSNIVYGDATGQSYNATENKLNGTFNCQ